MRTLLLSIFAIITLQLNAQIWVEEQKFLSDLPAYNNLNNYYGCSVSIDGNYAVSGAYKAEGARGTVEVLYNNGTSWETIATLVASDGRSFDYFGNSVCISGDYIVVGSNGDDDSGLESGSSYLFKKPTTGWTDMTETAKLTASDGEAFGEFGYSVSISGDNILIGAYKDNDNGSESGSAYIFSKPATGWSNMTETAKLTASDGAAGDWFARSVSLSGDNVIIGAYKDNDDGVGSGSAYLFSKPEAGWINMTETAKLTASNADNGHHFGISVNISEDLVVIGNQLFYDENTTYVFEKPLTGWTNMTETAKLTTSNNGGGSCFGSSISISNDYIVIGAYKDNGSETGSVYIFEKPALGWIDMTQTAKLTDSDPEGYVRFGKSVGISGDNIIIGAYQDNENGIHSGSVYFFKKPTSGWENMTETQKVTPILNFNSTNYTSGISVSIDGNYAVVGAYAGNNKKGYAYVLQKGGAGWETVAILTASDGVSGDFFGNSVSISGDNIVIGSYCHSANVLYSGTVYIFEKPISGWTDMTQTAKIWASDGGIADYFGTSVSISGDIVIAGAPGNDANGPNSGSVYIFEKPTNGWVNMYETAYLYASDSEAYEEFGNSVSISGDDIVIGAYKDNDNGSESGSCYIFEKPEAGWTDMTETAKLTASDGAVEDWFGNSVSISGDNVIIGAIQDDDDGFQSGSAYLFSKSVTGWVNMTETVKLTASDGSGSRHFGNSVHISGELVAIGNSYLYNSIPSSVYIFEKPITGWTNLTETTILNSSDGQLRDYFGSSLSISGRNILIGAKGVADNGFNSGAVYIFSSLLEITQNPESKINTCLGNAVQFTVSGCNITNYQWQESEDDGASWANLSDNATYSGTLSDTLIIITEGSLNGNRYRCYLSNNAEATTSVEVSLITDNQTPVITSTHNDISINANDNCGASLLDYTTSVTAIDNCPSNLIFSQSPIAGSIISGENNTITLIANDESGNFTNISFNISVLPVQGAFVEDSICSGGIYVYADGTEHVNVVVDEQYTSILIGEASNGCDSIVTENLYIKEGIFAEVPIFSNPSTSLCVNDEENYIIINDENTSSYHWIIPQGWIGESNINEMLLACNQESGFVVVWGENECGFSEKDSVYIDVVEDVPAQSSFISGPNPVCINSIANYSVVNIPNTEYYWDLPENWSGTGNNSLISVTTASSGGLISLVPSNACGMGEPRVLSVNVNSTLPVADFTYTGVQAEITFNNLSQGASSYYWEFGDNDNSVLEHPKHDYVYFNLYLARLTTYNSCGEHSKEQFIDWLSLSMSNPHKDVVSIYPNPTNGTVSIKGEYIKNIKITDVNGRLIDHITSPALLTVVDLSYEAKGFYFINVITQNEVVINKIVLE